jgi:hypothetical protein
LPVNDGEWELATENYDQFRNDNPGVQCEPTGMPRVRMQPALQGRFFGYEGQLIVEVTAEDAIACEAVAATAAKPDQCPTSLIVLASEILSESYEDISLPLPP